MESLCIEQTGSLMMRTKKFYANANRHLVAKRILLGVTLHSSKKSDALHYVGKGSNMHPVLLA